MMGDIQEIKSDTRIEELRSENARLAACQQIDQNEAARLAKSNTKLEYEVTLLKEQLAQSQTDCKAIQAKTAEVWITISELCTL